MLILTPDVAVAATLILGAAPVPAPGPADAAVPAPVAVSAPAKSPRWSAAPGRRLTSSSRTRRRRRRAVRCPGQSSGMAARPSWARGGRPGGNNYTTAIVKGFLVIDAPQMLMDTKPGFRAGLSRGNLLLHELGHVAGLDHVSSATVLMNKRLTGRTPNGYAAGDRAGWPRWVARPAASTGSGSGLQQLSASLGTTPTPRKRRGQTCTTPVLGPRSVLEEAVPSPLLHV